MNHEIYADHAATAPIEPLALEAMYTAYHSTRTPPHSTAAPCTPSRPWKKHG